MKLKRVDHWLVLTVSKHLMVSFKVFRGRYPAWLDRWRYDEPIGTRRCFGFGALGLNFAVNIIRSKPEARRYFADPADVPLSMSNDEIEREWNRLAAGAREIC